MITVMLTADAFATILLLIILYASIFEVKRKTPKDRIFNLFVLANCLLTAADTVSWIFDGNMNMLFLNYAASYFTISCAFPATYLFARYLIAIIEKYHSISQTHKRILDIFTVCATVVSLFACATGQLFTLEDAHYATTDGYIIYLLAVMSMYVYILALALKNFRVMGSYERGAFVIYSLSPFMAMTLDFLVEGLSLAYSATAISILFIYILLQSEYRQRAISREKELIESGNTDEMTGLKNRRAYDARLAKIPADAGTGVVFCDINGLKYFNDTYGHAAGDRLIATFAEHALTCFSKDDIFRISGDEFVVIAVGMTEENFRARSALLSRKESGSEYEMAAVGCGWGMGSEIDRLIRDAEESMYVQKAIFHRQFPKYIKKGALFVRNLTDDGNNLPPERVRDASEPELEESRRGSYTMLLIEDTEQHELVKRLLESDCNVIDCQDINEAVACLEARVHEISVVLIDAEPRKINASEFLQMKKANPAIAGVPVIVTSLQGERNAEARYLRQGAFDFMFRPYSPDMLLNRLRRTVEMRESAATLSAVEHDELTGLFTREVFSHRLSRTLERDAKTAYDLAIFDVENFKLVNERRGEKMADSVLHSMGAYIKNAEDGECLSGRYGADQFMLLIPHDRASAEGFWDRFIAGMEQNCPIDDIIIKCGLYENVDHSLTASMLCTRPLLALRTIKHQYGSSCARFDEKLQIKVRREQQLELTMEQAGREGQFKVFYQPKCDAATGRLMGAEALLRWQSPTFGFLPPDEFIPLFERNGFITDSDMFVWTHTAECIRRWRAEGLEVKPISVNASKRDFAGDRHFTGAMKALEDNGVPAELMHLELTESIFTERLDELGAQISKYREKGIKIELDDFGAGFSALNILGTLPVDAVKFDKSFVEEFHDSRKQKVLMSCISLVKSLGLVTVIEGVESSEQHDVITAMGADLIQGYYYSRPLPENEFEEYLRRENRLNAKN